MKKFELTTEFVTNVFGKKLFRIKSLIEFGDVKAGELGGYVEKEENISQDGNAWVFGDAKVSGDARVYDNAWVCGDTWVCDNARVYGDARVCGNAKVYGNAWVSGNARVCGNAKVSGNAWVSGNAEVSGDAWVSGDAEVSGDAWVRGNADYALVKGFGTEFRKQVKETRSGKIAKEYLAIADLMEEHFKEE